MGPVAIKIIGLISNQIFIQYIQYFHALPLKEAPVVTKGEKASAWQA